MADGRLELIDGARFATATLGYVPTQVHRLLGDLRTAIVAGEDLGPVVGSRRLDDASFGYDKAQVDAVLDQLLVGEAPPSAEQPVRPGPAVVAEPLAEAVDTESLKAAVRQIRFPMARRGENGYHVGDVDSCLDKVEMALAAGQPLDFLATVRFRMTRRRESGYEVGAVDDFIDRLAGGAVTSGSAMGDVGVGAGRRLMRWLGPASR